MKVEQKYDVLLKEIEPYMPMMKQASDTVVDQDVSKYPIFVFHQQEVAIGLNVVDRKKVLGNWSVNVSTLEEFVSKRLIEEEHVEDFKTKYVDASKTYCLFVLSEMGAEFVFFPRIA